MFFFVQEKREMVMNMQRICFCNFCYKIKFKTQSLRSIFNNNPIVRAVHFWHGLTCSLFIRKVTIYQLLLKWYWKTKTQFLYDLDSLGIIRKILKIFLYCPQIYSVIEMRK